MGEEVMRLPQVYVALQADGLRLTAKENTLVFINKVKLDAKVSV